MTDTVTAGAEAAAGFGKRCLQHGQLRFGDLGQPAFDKEETHRLRSADAARETLSFLF